MTKILEITHIQRHGRTLSRGLVLLVMCGLFFSSTTTAQGFYATGVLLEELNPLIKHVHEPQWVVTYNFTHGCFDRFKGKENLHEVIAASLRVWIQPLRELYPDKHFVDDFVFKRLPDVPPSDPEKGPHEADKCFRRAGEHTQAGSHVHINFTCQRGVSYADWDEKHPPQVCMRCWGGNIRDDACVGVLTHELGHTFGMLDTYVIEGYDEPSTGGLASTIGQQPSSVMSILTGASHGQPYIAEDDKNGIIWMYKYLHEGYRGDCFFPDYVRVERRRVHKFEGNCEPRYPLIFEVKHGGIKNVQDILRDDPNLEHNARDSFGNTALHYAVLLERPHVVELLLAHPKIAVNVLDAFGLRPAELARKLEQFQVVKLIEAHPTAKLPPLRIVPTRQHLAATWAEVKRRR